MAKIDMSEVKLLKEDLTKNADKAVSSIAETKANLGKIKDMDSFKGDGAKATKNYISSAHNNLIEVYDNIIEDLKSNFAYSMDQFSGSVDNDGSCIIDSNYVTQLKTEVTSATKSISSSIKSINTEISSISDITSASKVQTTEFKNDEKEFKKIITDMMDKFEAFISSSSNEVSQSKEFMGILTSMQGQVQKISSVSDGITTFKKSDIEKFKEWKEKFGTLRSFASKTAKVEGNLRFMYHLSKGHIKITRAKNGKLLMKIVNEKAILREFKKIKKTGPLFKRYKFVSEWKTNTVSKSLHHKKTGKLNLRGERYYDNWGLEKALTETSKKTLSQRLKGKLTGPFTGWKDLTKFGKGMKAAGIVGLGIETGLSGYENFNDATKQGLTGSKRVVSTTVNTGVDMGVSIGGAAAGAKAGAAIGTAIGSIFPGPGNLIGAAVGSIVGAAAGSWAASEASKKIREGLKKTVNNVVKDGIGKSIKKLGNWAFG
ncbi:MULTISPECIES: T7SS effector LXG polymorphic toxin [unclassified Enterococcus]|uniref:T7SS effector LXG polymorphic toxin n=1 Tax=unclassified Enterococcus TaxID=2608891 RepID=UPI001CE1799A|nr:MULTISPECIES: T7SS effector LXG polymorphic toxin [unclassified Enterococcus]MCA5014319.1 hypothetical protein [Enterococcus sp. S23]MCA5017730.1 hypothetical protein [Enterococcus sp. S22(2020)]